MVFGLSFVVVVVVAPPESVKGVLESVKKALHLFLFHNLDDDLVDVACIDIAM